MIIRVRDESGNFVILPLGGGDVSQEQIQEAVAEYLKENPITETDPTVPDWAKQPNKPKYRVDEIENAVHKYDVGDVKELSIGVNTVEGINSLYETKAEKSDTLSKLMFDQYREENEITLNGKADKSTTYTKDETKEFVNSCVVKETILYEDVVNPPEWTNQPTYEGTLDSAFNTTDFYYVTLKDESGNTLQSGQFMLKDSRGTNATIYSTVFSFSVPASGILVENFPVEFTEIGETVKMRDAGVWRIEYTPKTWNLKGSTGSMKIKIIGEFVQREDNAYFLPVFGTSQKVSSYHSGHKTAMQSASTKQIIPFASLSANYKTNRFYEESVLERNGDKNFTFKRRGFLRYIKDGDTTYSIIDYDTVGYGDILTETELSSVAIQTAAEQKKGMLRNGTIIRVSEVV